jgi:VWFA-related protein
MAAAMRSPISPQSAFTVYEDGKPQDIAFFEAGDVPVTVGLVIDNSTSMLTERDLVVAGTRAFAESSHPEDQMFAVVFNERVRLGLPSSIDFTTNRLQLIASLARFRPGGKTALYDAVIAGLDQLEKGNTRNTCSSCSATAATTPASTPRRTCCDASRRAAH